MTTRLLLLLLCVSGKASAQEGTFSVEEVNRGKEIFLGHKFLARGGPVCFSCHTAQDYRSYGGAMPGPDLTGVFSRLGGRQSLAATLANPTTAIMKQMFTDRPMEKEEILGLLAFFEHIDDSPKGSTNVWNILLLALGGLAAGILVFALFWKAQRRPGKTSNASA